MSLSSLCQQKTIKNCQNFLAKDLQDHCIGMNINKKSENKNTTNIYRYFLESNFVGVNRLFVLVYLNGGNDVKQDLNLKDITYQKALWRIIMSSSMKITFVMNQLILSKKMKETYQQDKMKIRLQYDCIKNH